MALLPVIVFQTALAQDPTAALKRGIAAFEADAQMTHGILGIYVADAATGKVVHQHNGRVGLVPASSQKIVTAATALELLGEDFRYRTKFGYAGPVVSGTLRGDIVVEGAGDPTMGGMRYPETSTTAMEGRMTVALRKAGIVKVTGGVTGYTLGYERSTIPDGWLWEDIGNYYGAGHGALNWHENQYELWLKPGAKEGEPVELLKTDPILHGERFDNELRTGKAGSGDQAFLYFVPGKPELVVRGTIPCCMSGFRVAGAVVDPVTFTLRQVRKITGAEGDVQVRSNPTAAELQSIQPLFIHQSPGLDSIVHGFLQKSVNLYGEALIHTLSAQKNGQASYEGGLDLLKDFWESRGIGRHELNMADGSGLSPVNRVTAEALTKVLIFARQRPWFKAFDRAMPVHNGIRMKSGTMSGVRAYAGYVKSAGGKEYVFSVIVNNFSGSGASINRKLRELLDVLR